MSTTAPEAIIPPRAVRAPVSVTHKRSPKASEFTWALNWVARLGEPFLEALRRAIGEGIGRPGSVPARAVLVAWALLVTEESHKAEITDVVAQLVSLSEAQLAELGMKPLPTNRAYKRVHDKFSRIRRAMETGFQFIDAAGTRVDVDLDWWSSYGAQMAIPDDLPSSRTRAVDGTDWETAGRFRQQTKPEYDGDAPADADVDLANHEQAILKTRAKIAKRGWPIGPDGRAIYTTDPDARGGYRTATEGRKGGYYVGSEVHLSVQTRDFTWQGDIRGVTNGPEVPGFVTGAALAPAGSHRADSAVPMILREKDRIDQVVWDRGYSILKFESAHGRLLAASIQAVFDLTSIQRDHPAVSDQAIWIDGHPFHQYTPDHLRNLARPPMGATAEERKKYEELFNERAVWRWSKQAGPDADGVTRWICPFHAGRLRCRSIRQAKVSKSAILVELPEGTTKCCKGTLQVSAEYYNLIQACAIPYGTSAHNQAYSRRNAVELANSYLGGTYINLERPYSRLMGHTNRKFILGVMLAGLNRYIERNWRAKVAEAAAVERKAATRARRRHNTLDDLLNEKPRNPSATAPRPPMRT